MVMLNKTHIYKMTNEPIVIIGSARRESDTKSFVEFTFKGIDFKTLDLLDHSVSPYNYDNKYPDEDTFLKIIDEILKHTIIVFATPVYWYAMSGLMKNFFDRFTDLVTSKKEIGRQLNGKSVFLIAVGTDNKIPQGFDVPFKLTSDYLEMHYETSVYYSTNLDKAQVIDYKTGFVNALKARTANSAGQSTRRGSSQ
jgi:multimeric flavodoxin WrbA